MAALAAAAITVALVSILAGAARSAWFEAVVLLWWAAVIAHGWYLASREGQPTASPKLRAVALGVAVPVLLAAVLLRLDVSGIESHVAGARASGDCAHVLSGQHQIWLGDRIADSPLAARGDDDAAACRRLQAAEASLTTGLDGGAGPLASGFTTLNSLLADPANGKMVEVALNRFSGELSTTDQCGTAAVTDWLRARRPSHNILDQSAQVAARVAPAALADCGNELMASQEWQDARGRYQQLLDQYPGDAHAAEARAGVRKATLGYELANVRQLLDDSGGGQPQYCSSPAPYGGAAPYGHGTNPALFYGNDGYTGKLPGSWKASDAANATLVVCAGSSRQGASVQTCPYTSEDSSSPTTDVTFHKIAIPVKAYELRTGKLVYHGTVQISGASCPSTISYSSPIDYDPGPSPDENVKPSTADVRAAFSPVINR